MPPRGKYPFDQHNVGGLVGIDARLAFRHRHDRRFQPETQPGARNAAQVTENVASMSVAIPPAFWTELREAGVITANAPVPSAA